MPRRRVLIVEPLAWLREAESEILIKAGFHACPAPGMAEALAQAALCPPHAVLTRLLLEDGTGIELIAGLRNLGVHAPVIAVAGRAASGEALRRAGAVLVLLEPFDGPKLVEIVERALLS